MNTRVHQTTVNSIHSGDNDLFDGRMQELSLALTIFSIFLFTYPYTQPLTENFLPRILTADAKGLHFGKKNFWFTRRSGSWLIEQRPYSSNHIYIHASFNNHGSTKSPVSEKTTSCQVDASATRSAGGKVAEDL